MILKSTCLLYGHICQNKKIELCSMGKWFLNLKKEDIIEKITMHLVDLQWLWKNRR